MLSRWLYILVFQIFVSWSVRVTGLKCFVGLGNTSTRNIQELVECPAKKYYVCVKMYGGGMGDQIQRYCEKIKREDYNELLDIEEKNFRITKSTQIPLYQIPLVSHQSIMDGMSLFAFALWINVMDQRPVGPRVSIFFRVIMAEEANPAVQRKRPFRKFVYRGVDLDQLLDQSNKELMELFPCRIRRKYVRGLKRKQLTLMMKLRKKKKECLPMEKPDVVKTHLRNMVVVPEMTGSIVGVYNGKTFNQVEIKPEMIGHYLGEFSITYKPVKHGRPVQLNVAVKLEIRLFRLLALSIDYRRVRSPTMRSTSCLSTERLIKQETQIKNEKILLLEKDKVKTLSQILEKIDTTLIPTCVNVYKEEKCLIYYGMKIESDTPKIKFNLTIKDDLTYTMKIGKFKIPRNQVLEICPHSNIDKISQQYEISPLDENILSANLLEPHYEIETQVNVEDMQYESSNLDEKMIPPSLLEPHCEIETEIDDDETQHETLNLDEKIKPPILLGLLHPKIETDGLS
ncbi:RP-S15e [Lepeophtheirus salmonis]|uniref:40S ribosomal protein S15 n=1 Tax=Lepeophtheirus salmonis TaxID=72036 RepID=A0A7R8CCZ6_LEPSM|nr:RP-S15e [Lepeophtheirus salmonis]CAF2771230.1 RP-S15e [Lepeophtheirus salmonis]